MNTATATPHFNQTQVKALSLLASGVTPEQSALALGITPSAISQMISEESFAQRLAEMKFDALRKHNARDDELDSLEDSLIEQLKQTIGIVMDPMKLARLLGIINAAKRRGASAPEQIVQKQTVLTLNMPITLINKFTVNSLNQVISAGAQELVTIQSAQMKTLAAAQNQNGQHQQVIESTGREIASA